MKVPTNEAELKECQVAIDDMVESFNFMKLETEKLGKLLDDSLAVASARQLANDNLITTIKNIHITLNSHNELFHGCTQIEEMMKELAKFILSSEAIKSGVRQNAVN